MKCDISLAAVSARSTVFTDTTVFLFTYHRYLMKILQKKVDILFWCSETWAIDSQRYSSYIFISSSTIFTKTDPAYQNSSCCLFTEFLLDAGFFFSPITYMKLSPCFWRWVIKQKKSLFWLQSSMILQLLPLHSPAVHQRSEDDVKCPWWPHWELLPCCCSVSLNYSWALLKQAKVMFESALVITSTALCSADLRWPRAHSRPHELPHVFTVLLMAKSFQCGEAFRNLSAHHCTQTHSGYSHTKASATWSYRPDPTRQRVQHEWKRIHTYTKLNTCISSGVSCHFAALVLFYRWLNELIRCSALCKRLLLLFRTV